MRKQTDLWNNGESLSKIVQPNCRDVELVNNDFATSSLQDTKQGLS